MESRSLISLLLYFILAIDDYFNHKIYVIIFFIFILFSKSYILIVLFIFGICLDDVLDSISNMDIIILYYHYLNNSLIFFVILFFISLYYKTQSCNKIPLFFCCFIANNLLNIFNLQ